MNVGNIFVKIEVFQKIIKNVCSLNNKLAIWSTNSLEVILSESTILPRFESDFSI